MAQFISRKFDKSSIKNGEKYEPRDIPTAAQFNSVVEGLVYATENLGSGGGSSGGGDVSSEELEALTTRVESLETSNTRLTQKVQQLEKTVGELTYVKIAITSFSSAPSVAEIGSTVNNPTLSWLINKSPHAISIDGSLVNVPTTANVVSYYEVSGSFNKNKTWTLSAEDSDLTVVTRSTTLSFLNGVYWGVGKDGEYNSAMILGLGHKELKSTHVSSFNVVPSATDYIFYCVPIRFGTCKFKIGGFEGGFEEPKIVSFTNASGYTEDYYVYRSTNLNLGDTTVEVI